jgi:hypothetical protein
MADTTIQQIQNLSAQFTNLAAGYAGATQASVLNTALGSFNVFGGMVTNELYAATTITSSSVANPTVITTAAAHNLTTGDYVEIVGHTGSTPSLIGYNGPVTVLTSTTFSLPVNVTVGGSGGTVRKITMVLSVNGQAAGDSANWNPLYASPPVRISQYGNTALVQGGSWYRDQVNVGTLTDSSWTIPTAPSAGYHRYDVVYAYLAPGVGPSIGVVSGTAVLNASTPAAPTIPLETIALAQIHVQSSVVGIISTDIADLRNFNGRLKGSPPTITGTSTTSQTITNTGSMTFTTQANIVWLVGQELDIISSASPSNLMVGAITAYSGTTLTVSLTSSVGSGTFASWNIGLTGLTGLTGATGATGATGPTGPTGATGPTGPAPTITGTSTTSLTIGTGSQIFTTQSGIDWVAGEWLVAASNAAPSNYMTGQITAYSGTSLTVNVVAVGGSGAHADWNISISGAEGPTGATGATGATGPTGATGATGPTGPTGPGWNQWKGAWSSLTAYIINDTVSEGGSSYICILGNTNQVPPNATYWNLVAQAGSGSGTVTSVSVVSANGLAGTFATATTTPALTLSTTVTGITKGNGTALSAATAGTDYSAGTSALGTGIVKTTTGTGALTVAVAADFPTLNQNTTGTAAVATAANGLNSATTTVVINAATAPTAGQVLTATSSTAADWATPSAGGVGLDHGFLLSNDATTPNTVLDIAAGSRPDSTFTVQITGTAFTKNTTGTFVAGTGNAGMGTGLTVAASTWYHVFAIIYSGSYDVYFDTSPTAANAPAGTTAHRYIGSFLTDGSSNIRLFRQIGQKFLWYQGPPNGDLSNGTATTVTPITLLNVPPGFTVTYEASVQYTASAAGHNFILLNGNDPLVGGAPINLTGSVASANNAYYISISTNTSAQISYRVISGDALNLFGAAYINPHVSPQASE